MYRDKERDKRKGQQVKPLEEEEEEKKVGILLIR